MYIENKHTNTSAHTPGKGKEVGNINTGSNKHETHDTHGKHVTHEAGREFGSVHAPSNTQGTHGSHIVGLKKLARYKLRCQLQYKWNTWKTWSKRNT